jgi:hypothetical protein
MDTQALYVVTAVTGLLAVGTVTGLVVEYTQWRAGRRIYGRRQWLLRLLGGLLLLTILGMIFVGVVIMDFQSPYTLGAYWGVCLLLLFGLLVLAVADLRQLLWCQLQKERELNEEMARTLSRPSVPPVEAGPAGPSRGNGDRV